MPPSMLSWCYVLLHNEACYRILISHSINDIFVVSCYSGPGAIIANLTMQKWGTLVLIFTQNWMIQTYRDTNEAICRLARDLRSKMSQIHLPIVKSFRISLCEQP